MEVGLGDARSIVRLALACLDRDVTFYPVESFAGDDNGTFDGWPLPALERYATNVRSRFPFLWINPVFARSEHASKTFTERSLDALFIDACHSEENVRNDILCWLPKLKDGGVIFGNDWGWESVQRGVHSVFDSEVVSLSRNGYLWVVRLEISAHGHRVLVGESLATV